MFKESAGITYSKANEPSPEMSLMTRGSKPRETTVSTRSLSPAKFSTSLQKQRHALSATVEVDK